MDPITFAALNLVIQDFEKKKYNNSVKTTPKVSYPRRPIFTFKGSKKVNNKMKHPIIQPRGQNH
tara:strand:+ start:1173 stop:1364 length:192 start_codon:yes stop_codon:yes gene_type:complete